MQNTLLNSRVSCPRVLDEPPTAKQVERLLQAAVSAPDHGRLRPWRFLVLQGDERLVLGNAMAAVQKRDMPECDEAALGRVRDKVLRAPMIIVVGADITQNHRVPEIEQMMSATCAAEHIMLSAYEQGLGIMWRTGKFAFDHDIKRALGFAAKDAIVGFLYIGQIDQALPERELLNPNDYVKTLP